MKNRSALGSSFRIVALYALFAALWILFSDRLLLPFVHDPVTLMWISTGKGWLFVVVTASLLYLLISREMLRRSALENRLREGLANQEALTAEVHHRVKNNLQIITSILNLERDELVDEESRHLLDRTRARVYSMSLVHERLYEAQSFSRIDLGSYLRNLTNALSDIYNHSSIRFDFELDSVEAEGAIAVPFGLLASEAITNSMKYGLGAGHVGRIRVSLRDLGKGRAEFTVRDEGQGFPSAMAEGLGFRLMEALAAQLHGLLERNNEGGAVVRMNFDLERTDGSRGS
ncbi:MAG TPA: sensor histidine kinase [Rectinemataceae bacterium]|nr:sensor histidine kinase [Rectinemataceae bacterium]